MFLSVVGQLEVSGPAQTNLTSKAGHPGLHEGYGLALPVPEHHLGERQGQAAVHQRELRRARIFGSKRKLKGRDLSDLRLQVACLFPPNLSRPHPE